MVATDRDEVLEVARWARGIAGVHGCIAERFHRSEPIETSGRGKPLARTVKRALALLKADAGRADREVAAAVSLSAATVARVRRRFVEE